MNLVLGLLTVIFMTAFMAACVVILAAGAIDYVSGLIKEWRGK